MDVGLILAIAIIMAFVTWLIVNFNEALGEFIGFVLALPIAIPLVILIISAFISIKGAPSGTEFQAADTAIAGIIEFFKSHIFDAVIGDLAGIIVGALIALFTSTSQ
jgi:hypothetical protein